MSTSNPSQLLLLADHIKLSLLERQRALSLNLPSNAQDSQITRSLDTLQAGLQALEARTLQSGDPLQQTPEQELLAQLKGQYVDLNAKFRGHGPAGGSKSTREPNDAALRPDFEAATATATAAPSRTSTRVRSPPGASSKMSKSVRFTDNPSSPSLSPNLNPADANRAALFPYRDDPSDDEAGPDQTDLSNDRIHAYHQTVLAEQDEQLDRLGDSIGRQRELSIAIGDELDEHVMLLDDVDEHVDRHQGQLDGAKKRLNWVARAAKENWSVTTIVVLIIILVLLIVITKR